MKKPPPIIVLRHWLTENDPLGLFAGIEFTLTDIDPKPWSGHFNYLVTSGGKRMVLRFKGPEWGDIYPKATGLRDVSGYITTALAENEKGFFVFRSLVVINGIRDEYKILRAIASHRVGPKPYTLIDDFFGEPAMFCEYLNGTIFTALSKKEQPLLFPAVARFIARLNTIPFPTELLRSAEDLTSYAHHKKIWKARLKDISENPVTHVWGKKIESLVLTAETMLDGFENVFGETLKQHAAFVFTSAHAGHLFKMSRGFRFVNWERIGRGDPSYSLAVFLASLKDDSDFENIQERMVAAYCTKNPVPHFKELLEARLKERAVSDLTWVLSNYIRSGSKLSPEKATSVVRRFAQVARMLATEG